MKKVLVIFLSYYNQYAATSLKALESMLKLSGTPYELIVVNNGSKPPTVRGHTLIEGDNTWHEFSGWQAGLNHAKQSGSLSRYSGLVLANDTIGHHNRFGPVSQFAFARALKKLLKLNQPNAAGECWDFYTEYEVAGYRNNRWITSSLLMVNQAAISAVDPLIAPGIAVAAEPDAYFENFGASAALRSQIQGWLGLIKLPAGKPLWYGACNDNTQGYTKKIAQKAAMILLEYRLSAQMSHNGTILNEVFNNPILRQLRRLERRPAKVNKSH